MKHIVEMSKWWSGPITDPHWESRARLWVELQWTGGFHPSSVDFQAEDASQSVASLHTLSPHLLRILTAVQVSEHVHDRGRTEQEPKDPGQRALHEQRGPPAPASQKQTTSQKR